MGYQLRYLIRKLVLALNSVLLFSIIASAQPSLQWQKCYGGSGLDSPKSMQSTIDGGYVVVGTTASVNGDVFGNHGATDWWILKINASGTSQWRRTYGGSDLESLYSVKQTPDEGFILAGYTLSNNGNVSGNHGDYDYWVVKLNKDGAIEWQKTYGGSDDDEALDIVLSPDGGYLIAGYSASEDGDRSVHLGQSDFWIIKIDGQGNMLWEKSYGGSGADNAYSIYACEGGGYIVTGETYSHNGDVSGLHGSNDAWVLKIDHEGTFEWQIALGGAAFELGVCAIQTSSGDYLVAVLTGSGDGEVSDSHGLFDYWIVCLDLTGKIKWKKAFGGSQNDAPQSICEDNDGNFVISGTSDSNDGDVLMNHGSDAWIIKINNLGELIWQKTFGGTYTETASKVTTTADGGYIFTGETYSNDGDVQGNHGGVDFWVVKLSAAASPVEEVVSDPVRFYPNPAPKSAQIQLPESIHPAALGVFDAYGKAVIPFHPFPQNGILDLEHLPCGPYLIRMLDETGKLFSGKILKQ